MRKYVGKGAWIMGVPARDLTNAEAKKFEKIIAEQERLSGIAIYEQAPQKSDKSPLAEQENKS